MESILAVWPRIRTFPTSDSGDGNLKSRGELLAGSTLIWTKAQPRGLCHGNERRNLCVKSHFEEAMVFQRRNRPLQRCKFERIRISFFESEDAVGGSPGFGSQRSSRSVKAGAQSDSRPGSKASGTVVLMEVEGVVADVYRFGHRQGFNLAFQELGLDCAQWSEGVFADLLRAAGGVEESMLALYFNKIGWPAALPTNQQAAFTSKVLQAKTRALEKLAESIPLRPGLETFVDEVLAAGVPLVILGAYSKGGEGFARLLVEKLGSERSIRIKVLGEADVRNSSYGQVVLGEGVSSGLDEQLAEAASIAVATEKQRIAEEVASLLQISVEIDTSFPQDSKKIIAALRAGAEIGGVEIDKCILLASGLAGSQAASRIGMPCVVVRSSLTSRGEFPAAKVVLDGYGAGSTTFSRLLKFI